MNDQELDQVLNRWKTPEPPAGLRARVLARYPRPELRNFGRRLRWGLAMAAVLCLLAIGSEQSGGGTLENIGDGIVRLHNETIHWLGDLWVGHIADAFRNSNPKVYVDGDLRARRGIRRRGNRRLVAGAGGREVSGRPASDRDGGQSSSARRCF